jgi:hypothetical protein
VSWRLVDGPWAVGSEFSCGDGTSLCGRRSAVTCWYLLSPIHLSNSLDEWKCHYSIGGIFSVSTLYCYLAGIIIFLVSLEPDLVKDLSFLWKSSTPSKVIVFS